MIITTDTIENATSAINDIIENIIVNTIEIITAAMIADITRGTITHDAHIDTTITVAEASLDHDATEMIMSTAPPQVTQDVIIATAGAIHTVITTTAMAN